MPSTLPFESTFPSIDVDETWLCWCLHAGGECKLIEGVGDRARAGQMLVAFGAV